MANTEKSARLLLIDSNEDDLAAVARAFASEPWYLVTMTDGALGLEAALDQPFDTVICSYRLMGMGGLALLATLKKKRPHLPVVMTSAMSASDTAIEVIKAGAFDFLAKPLDYDELRRVVNEAVAASRRMSKPVQITTDAPSFSMGSEDGKRDALIGKSRAMLEVYKSLGRLSATPVTVLIRGETGTGKELIARALYQHGHRAHKPFITVNCAAIPENLLESELFGHEKGAFTGAVATRIGKFEQANDATLFLDEIGDLDMSLQSKLLRVLQERQMQRVGGRADIPVDVRIIAATHQDLDKMVAEGRFREDLFYRLNVASIDLPPLRDRRDDIGMLTNYFLQRSARELHVEPPAITTRAIGFLESQTWPGNVRQLQNVVRRALLYGRGFTIDTADLQPLLRETQVSGDDGGGGSQEEESSDSLRALSKIVLERAKSGEIEAAHPALIELAERELFSAALQLSDGNQAKAARWLGISRLTLRQRLQQFGIHPKS